MRDLSTLSPDDARDIERLHRHEHREEQEDEEYYDGESVPYGMLAPDPTESFSGDFWQ
jgi:hypothetical protein